MQYRQSGLSSGYLPVNAVAGAGSTCGARSPDRRSPQSSPMYPDWDRSWRRRRERSRCLSISRLDDPLDATRSLRCARSASRRQCRRLLPAGWRAVRHRASRANSADPALASVPRYAAGTAGQLPPSPPGPCVRESQHPRPCACTHVAHAPGDGRVRDGQMALRVRLAVALRPGPG
jgi:hypothetical protein